MKAYMSTDMEGISGVSRRGYMLRDNPKGAEGRQLLLGDVNAAIARAFDGGATYAPAKDVIRFWPGPAPRCYIGCSL